MLSGIMGMINGATEATGGLNLALAALAGVIVVAAIAYTKMTTSMGAAFSASTALKYVFLGVQTSASGATVAVSGLGVALRAVMAATVVGLVVSAIAGLVGWLVSLGDESERTAKK